MIGKIFGIILLILMGVFSICAFIIASAMDNMTLEDKARDNDDF